MSFKKKIISTDMLSCIGCLPVSISVIYLCSCLFNVSKIYHDILLGDIKTLSLIFGAILFLVVFGFLMRIVFLKDDYESEIINLEARRAKFQNDLESKYIEKENELQNSIDKKELEIKKKEQLVKGFVDSLDKEKYCAELISDFNTVLFENAANRLEHKYRPAPASAEIVRQSKEIAKKHIEELKKYKYSESERISRIESDAQHKVNEALIQRDMMQKAATRIKSLMETITPFKDVTELYADAISVAYESIAQELREKVRPAHARADEITQKLKKQIREESYKAKHLEYRWNFLLSIMPELEEYVFEDESLLSMAEYKNLDDFNDNRDRARDYLSEDEYNNLSDVEKYQLSLDRYKAKRKPSAWIAGAEYEMFCSYILREKGYIVIENGIKMLKEDMGRDIIAYKDGKTYIIQCKRYSLQNRDGTNRYVHENVICQLFGTTYEYQIANPDNSLFENLNTVIPVLYTTGRLSETAKLFAERLNVKIETLDMGEYPMIKCNINEGNRIYHLPFDQQYWNTKIDRSDEFYAWTVQEAENAGFRRARRWKGESIE